MAGFGGAIKLTGANEYREALSRITQNIKENASEMQLLATQYDRTDKSEQAMTERARVLNDLLGSQREKLRVLQEQYANLASRVQEEAEKHRSLTERYEAEKQKLEQLANTLGRNSDEYKNQQAVVEDLAYQVGKSTSANEANERSLSAIRTQMNLVQAEANGTANQIEKLGQETEESGEEAEKASNGGYTVFKNILANLATKAITGAIQALQRLGSQFVAIGRQAVESYGQYEQMVGGIKKLFDSKEFGTEGVERVLKNAGEAYKTAGLSATQYMETITTFSSSLIKGLNGDTVKASEIADMAIRDMSDNANAFGRSMDEIENAYRGFARQNYLMLDNLQLGYGGSATEMAKLINDSKVLGDTVEVTAKTVKDVPFDKIVEAIHVTQERIGILGQTNMEASTTIQGSTKAMRASWQNLVTGMADDNADFEALVNNFISTLDDGNGGGAFNQLLPRVTTAINGISKAIQMLVPTLVRSVAPMITDNLPTILKAVQDALKAILELLPTIMPTIRMLIPDIVNNLINNLPMVVDTGLQIILGLLEGIIDATPQLLNMMPQIVTELVDAIMGHGQEVLEVGVKLIGLFLVGIFQSLHSLAQAGVKVLESLNDAFAPIKDWSYNVGKNLVQGIWNGISGAYTWITNKIRGWVGNVTAFIKRLFGIHSPSTLFRDEIGENLALGIGEGFSDEMEDVSRMMADSIPTSFDINSPTVNGARYEQLDMISAFKEALSQMKIELDDEVAGRFVENTVSRAIYA